jgi:hypothetical protein
MTSSATSPARTILSRINPISATGFGLHNSSFYDRVRPSYPPSVLEQVHRELSKGGTEKDLNLLELGSGTVSSFFLLPDDVIGERIGVTAWLIRADICLQGIFTRLIVSPPDGYPSFSIKKLTALEPSEGMVSQLPRYDRLSLAVLFRALLAHAGLFTSLQRQTFNEAILPVAVAAKVECLEGSFSDFPSQVKDGSIDGCVVAQAFHWVSLWCSSNDSDSFRVDIVGGLLHPGRPGLRWPNCKFSLLPCSIRAFSNLREQTVT